MSPSQAPEPPVSVLGRAVAIVEALYASPSGLALSELARAVGLPKSTTHRLADELCAHRILERTEDGYGLGMHLFELGAGVPAQRSLREAALPLMADLREATRCTVHLAVLDQVDVVYVQVLNSADAKRLPSRLGGRLPAHATGVGKAILAFSDPAVVTARIEAGLVRRTPRTIVTPGHLTRELDQIRETGVAYDREESSPGINCVAAPVFAGGKVVAGLSVTGTSARSVGRVEPAVRAVALALGRSITRDPAPAPSAPRRGPATSAR